VKDEEDIFFPPERVAWCGAGNLFGERKMSPKPMVIDFEVHRTDWLVALQHTVNPHKFIFEDVKSHSAPTCFGLYGS
jgi:hypothetical protein